mmetsp:Transcript_68877/g.143588  ORF Transcript_68877/g.143588 Transcript_68877/m.143588 type:complete len:84 (-) Transcript_68877:147-398(-)
MSEQDGWGWGGETGRQNEWGGEGNGVGRGCLRGELRGWRRRCQQEQTEVLVEGNADWTRRVHDQEMSEHGRRLSRGMTRDAAG